MCHESCTLNKLTPHSIASQCPQPKPKGLVEVSIQSTGGPRLGGRPSTSPARSNEKARPATCWPGWLGRGCAVKGGKAKANEPHESQCEPAGVTSPLPSVGVLTKHSPPSLPVRTSSASMAAGPMSAANTATKLRKAAMLFHRGRFDGDDNWVNTARIIETSSCAMPTPTVIIQPMSSTAPAPTVRR